MGYELAEQLGWTLPDAILYPTGGGTGLVGMWKAFDEMEELGWIGSERPRMVCVQAEGCAPIVKAWDEGHDHRKCGVGRLQQPRDCACRSLTGTIYPRILRKSDGIAISVTDEEIMKPFGTGPGLKEYSQRQREPRF